MGRVSLSLALKEQTVNRVVKGAWTPGDHWILDNDEAVREGLPKEVTHELWVGVVWNVCGNTAGSVRLAIYEK